jgi:hypothetical protein
VGELWDMKTLIARNSVLYGQIKIFPVTYWVGKAVHIFILIISEVKANLQQGKN